MAKIEYNIFSVFLLVSESLFQGDLKIFYTMKQKVFRFKFFLLLPTFGV